MAQVKGTLQYDPRANKGGYYALKIDGVYYSCGKSDPGVRKGDLVEFDAVQNGEYWNVKGDIKKIEGEASVAPKTGNSGSASGGSRYERPFPVPTRHGDRTIIRQNCLGHATALVGVITPNSDLNTSANEVVRVAKIFEQYAAGDDERRQDEAKLAQATAAQMRGAE